MSRGLADAPQEQPKDGVSLEEISNDIDEIFSIFNIVFSKLETIEKILGHSLDLPEAEAADRKRVTGL